MIEPMTVMLLGCAVLFVVIWCVLGRTAGSSPGQESLRDEVCRLCHYQLLLDECALVSRSDPQGNIISVNEAMCRATGYSRAELLGQPHSIFRHPVEPRETFRHMWNTILGKQIWRGVLRSRRKDGSAVWAAATICPILDRQGEIAEFIAARVDVTELMERRQEAEQILVTDALTGLGSRFRLMRDIQAGDGAEATLLLLDLDAFGSINELFGFAAADQLLRDFAARLRSRCVGPAYHLYRLHGDRFAVLLPAGWSREKVDSCAELLIRQLTDLPYGIVDQEIRLKLSIGAAFRMTNPLLWADMALQHAKEQKKNWLVIEAQQDLQKRFAANLTCLGRLRSALNERRLVPFFQPIVRAVDGEVEKYEALARIIEPDGTVFAPGHFLVLAKKARLYSDITRAIVQSSMLKPKGLSSMTKSNALCGGCRRLAAASPSTISAPAIPILNG